MNSGKTIAICRQLICLLACSLFLGAAIEAGAQGKIPTMENYNIGFDQKFHAGVWTPVTVTMENRLLPGESAAELEDFNGRIEVEVTSESKKPIIFSREIVLPRGSTKNFTIYAHFPDSTSLLTGRPPGKIVLRNAKGRKLREEDLNATAQEPSRPLILIATEDQTLAKFNLPPRYGARKQSWSRTSAEYLPDHWCGYQGVGLLVIPRLERNRMSAEQQTAIVKWVESGGRLLVLGGPDADSYAESFLESEFGISYMEPLSVELPRNPLNPSQPSGPDGESTFTTDVSPLQMPLAETLLKDGTLQLAARVEYGLGYVDAWAFDLEDKNVSQAPLVRMLWESPVGDVRSPALSSHFGQFMEQRGQMFKDNEGQKAPSVPLIVLILLIYFVVVGPINFIALGRRKKLEWAWFTLPVIIFVFTFGIYVIGVMTKGKGRIMRHYNIVDCRLNQPCGLLNSVIYLWSSSKRAYEITPVGESAVVIDQEEWRSQKGGWNIDRYLISPFDEDINFLGASNALDAVRKGRSRLSFTGSAMKVDAKDMNQWDRGFLSLQESLKLDQGFQGTVYWQRTGQGGNALQGKIVNNTPYRFEDVFLVMSNGFSSTTAQRRGNFNGPSLVGVPLSLGNERESWEPGEELIIDPASYSTSRTSPVRALKPSISDSKSMSDEQKFQRQVLSELLQSRFEQADEDTRKTSYVYRRNDHVTAYLVGWCVEPMARAKLSPAPTTEDSYSLFVLDLSPEQPGDTYVLENRAMRPMLSDATGGQQGVVGFGGGYGGYGGYGETKLQINNGNVILAFHAPIQSSPFKPGDLEVRYQVGSDSGAKNLYVYMYNYQESSWETIENWRGDPQAQQQTAAPNVFQSYRIPASRSANYLNPFSGEILFRLVAVVPQGQSSRNQNDTFLENLDVRLDITKQEVEL